MAELRSREFKRQELIREGLSPHIKDLMDHYARAATNNVAGADSVAVCVDIREHSKSAADVVRRQRSAIGGKKQDARLDLFRCNQSGDQEKAMRSIAAEALRKYGQNKRSESNSEYERRGIASAAATFTIEDMGHYYYTVTFVAKGELVKASSQEDASRIGSAIIGKVNDILSEVPKATDAYEGNAKDASFDELIARDGECMFTQW